MPAPGQAMNNGGANAIAQNYQLRQMLLNTAPVARKKLGTFTGTLGGDVRVKLFNVGITTRLIITANMTSTSGVGQTLSNRGVHSLLSRVKLIDYDGTERVSATGFQLHALNSFRQGRVYGIDIAAVGTSGTDLIWASNILTPPSVPVATTANVRTRYVTEVPLAYSPTDLRGALLSQTAVGEAYLVLSVASALNAASSDEYMFATATVPSGVAITFDVEQEYIIPQTVSGQVPLPLLDLMTVYEIQGNLRTSDNLSLNSEKLLNYPNVRSVIGFYANYVNNSLLTAPVTISGATETLNISNFRLIANGNNVIREYSPYTKHQDMRDKLNGNDYQAGVIYEDHRARPIETSLFGNVQYGITPGTALSGTSYIETMFESFYAKGSTLPGLSQGS